MRTSLLTLIVAASSVVGCVAPQRSPPPVPFSETPQPETLENYEVRMLGDCEYVVVPMGYGADRYYSLTHKGDCENPIHCHNK